MIAERLPAVFYGGDYAPEQWPESVWAEDVQLMRKAGVNLVTLGSFAWAKLQPQPDTFKFGWMDRVLDLLHANGIAVNLATGTAAPPPWMARLYPESLPQDARGVRYHAGSCQHYCPNSGAYRQSSANLARQLAVRYGQHPALLTWQVNHRYGQHLDACYCGVCAARFRTWLREKYGSLDALNEQWSTAVQSQWYHDWEEVQPPLFTPAATNPCQELDYRRFMNESFLRCFVTEKNVLKEVTPGIPVTTPFTGPAGLSEAINCFEWSRHVDFVSFASQFDPRNTNPADMAFSFDLQRGLAQGRPWVLTQQAPLPASECESATIVPPGELRLWCQQALARGADGILPQPWRAPRGGASKLEGAMLPHGGENTRAHREVLQLGAELARLGAICGSRSKAEIGLIVDWESLWAMQLDPRRGGLDYQELVLSYYRALFEPDPAIDIVQPEADLTHYKLVVAPGLYLVRDGVAENLAHFVANGGTLVMSIFSGIVDSSHRVLTGGFPAPFRRILGIHIEEMEAIPTDVVRHVRGPGHSAKCARWADVIQLEGAEAVATFTETFYAGQPAITRNAFGRGLAYYLGTQVDPDFLRGFFVGICDEIGIRPQFKVPAGVEAVARENDEGRFLFLLNHSPNSQLIELGGHEGRDMLTDELLEGQFQIPPSGVRVVHLV